MRKLQSTTGILKSSSGMINELDLRTLWRELDAYSTEVRNSLDPDLYFNLLLFPA